MIDKKLLFIIFIALIALLFITIMFVLLYRPIKKSILKKKYVEIYGKKIYLIARDFDYFLINNFDYKLSDGTKFHIDHLLFGEKYIYVINDMYIDGGINAKENDNAWIVFTKQKKQIKKRFVSNPLKDNKAIADSFVKLTRLENDYIKSIVLVNDDCSIEEFVQTSNNNYLSTVKKIYKLIQGIEKDNVPSLNQKQLGYAVNDIAKLNLNYKTENERN